MSEILRNFLVDLATDSKLMNDFIKDRKGALDRWSQGLSKKEKQALAKGDSMKIAQLLGGAKKPIPVIKPLAIVK